MATHKIAQGKKDAFLAAFRNSGIISVGARAAGVNRRRHYEWLENDPAYAADYAEAIEDATDALEATAVKMATGDNPNVTMLIVLLKMRGRFVERREHSGPGGGPVQHTAMTDDDRRVAQAIADRRLPPPATQQAGYTAKPVTEDDEDDDEDVAC